jgi:hypothetical protein
MSPLAMMAALAIHIEQHRLDRTLLPIDQGREQLMAGAADLLGRDARFEIRMRFACWRYCSTNCCGEGVAAVRPSRMDSR